jgi:ribose 5-phosphate isomerase RpiB
MKIAVINETSAADRNGDILKSLEGRGHEVLNVGMRKCGEAPELTYIHTSLMAALLLHARRVDYVVAGCGTGIGFLSAVVQYPNIFCGHILTPLDAWLYTQINGGNCVSLMLNQGYGWASDVNLGFIFDALFGVESGIGYPPHRRESQVQSRMTMNEITKATHRPMHEIVSLLPADVVRHTMRYPGFRELLDIDHLEDIKLANALKPFPAD